MFDQISLGIHSERANLEFLTRVCILLIKSTLFEYNIFTVIVYSADVTIVIIIPN